MSGKTAVIDLLDAAYELGMLTELMQIINKANEDAPGWGYLKAYAEEQIAPENRNGIIAH